MLLIYLVLCIPCVMWCVSDDETDFDSKHWYPIFSHTFFIASGICGATRIIETQRAVRQEREICS